MNPPDPSASKAKDFLGAWLLVAMLLLMMAANKLHPTVLEMLSIPDSRGRDVVPWHYIRRDFADGLCLAGALLISYTFAAISWRRFRPFAAMTLWLGIVFFALPIMRAVIIYVKCFHLFDPALAVCPWPDFDSYLNDASIQMARQWVPPFGVALAALLYAGADSRTEKRSKTCC